MFTLRIPPLFLFLAVGFHSFLLAGEPEFPYSTIPEALKANANAVVRLDEREISFLEGDEARYTVRRVVTVLNEEGKSNAVFVVYYDKLRKVKSASVRLLDQFGKEVEKAKQKDMLDMASSDGNFATDNRILALAPNTNSYPFTIVMEYELELKNLFTIPLWLVQDEENLAVEKALFTVTVPNGMGLRYKGYKMNEPAQLASSSSLSYEWKLENLSAVEDEYLAPSWRELVPVLFLIPENFEAEGLAGRSDSWESLGKFFYDLNDGRQTISPKLREEIHAKTDQVADPREKAQILYEMMQRHTRYVSIQLGMGGYQTFDAEYVYNNGYGDCKALTNYMKSMLQEVGIDSYAALVNSGDGAVPIIADFPSNQFNHVILCVPMEGDTVWLECTSQTQPFNYLGDFTEDRHVLLLMPDGGKLVRTPGSNADMNQRSRVADVTLAEDGTAKVAVSVMATGSQQDRLRLLAEEYGRQDQEKYIQRQVILSSFDLVDFQFSPGPEGAVPSYRLDYTLNARNVASKMGSRLFLTPNLLESAWGKLDDQEERAHAIELPIAFVDMDSVVIHLPQGFTIEAMPEPASIDSEFGTYHAEVVRQDDTTLVFTRHLRMEKMRLPASYYEQLQNFLEGMDKADRQKMVLNNRS